MVKCAVDNNKYNPIGYEFFNGDLDIRGVK
jgi:hypothetical protein